MDHESIIDRGYTGHEHFGEVSLIHMNGRMYDPDLHRFLSPDNYVQNPYNPQNFNRYSYALNNPFMYTDPSGQLLVESAIIAWLIKASPYIIAGGIMIGSAIANFWDDITSLQIERWFENGLRSIGDRFDGAKGALGGFLEKVFDFAFNLGSRKIAMPQSLISADPLININPGISSVNLSSGEWKPLTKEVLRDYVKETDCARCSSGQLENRTGRVFERAWNNAARRDPELIANNYRPNPSTGRFSGSYKGNKRNVAPDGIGDFLDIRNRKPVVYKDAAWYEVKAKNGYLYDSTNRGQIEGFITGLAESNRRAQRAGALVLHFITTSDVNISLGTRMTAMWHNVQLKHHIARYRMVNGTMQVQFGKVSDFWGSYVVYWSTAKTML